MRLLLTAIGFSTILAAQTLSGIVRSVEEGPMEGVVVTAQKANSIVTVSVVSDASGHYSFPAGRLEAGPNAIRIRAAGYDLEGSGQVTIGKGTTADLKLVKAADLSRQISNAEWLLSMPGGDDQKSFLLNCVNCHRLDLITRSRHDEAEFLKVLDRMGTYANSATPLKPQFKKADRVLEDRGESRQRTRQRQAAYLASINLHDGKWNYDLKTLPRPKGKGTQVIVTEYMLPRKTIQPHDVMLDADGMVWYSNFGEQEIGRFDPKTLKLTEYRVPVTKPGFAEGMLGMQMDREGYLWFGMSFQGALARLDRKTGAIQMYPLNNEFNADPTQTNMAVPQGRHVDGKVWMQNNGWAMIHRLDPATGRFENFSPFLNPKEGEFHNIYDVTPDSHNNAYFTDFQAAQIGRVDAKTGVSKTWKTPTPASAPRRGQIDSEDRFWFGEYRGNRIGRFDTKTEKFTEWEAPSPYSAPYDVAIDKNGSAWTGSMSTDRVLRLNPGTGEYTEYLMPRFTNIRRSFVDNSGAKPVFWVGNNHSAGILKIEPLD